MKGKKLSVFISIVSMFFCLFSFNVFAATKEDIKNGIAICNHKAVLVKDIIEFLNNQAKLNSDKNKKKCLKDLSTEYRVSLSSRDNLNKFFEFYENKKINANVSEKFVSTIGRVIKLMDGIEGELVELIKKIGKEKGFEKWCQDKFSKEYPEASKDMKALTDEFYETLKKSKNVKEKKSENKKKKSKKEKEQKSKKNVE